MGSAVEGRGNGDGDVVRVLALLVEGCLRFVLGDSYCVVSLSLCFRFLPQACNDDFASSSLGGLELESE